MLDAFETGARYQMYHALALFAVSWLRTRSAPAGVALGTTEGASGAGLPFAIAAGWLFLAGTVLFTGSLYAMALSGVGGLGAITPIGGVCFIAGWVSLAIAAARTGP